jgi:hypothetical protein
MFDTAALIGGSLFVMGNIALTFATITYIHHLFQKKNRNTRNDKLEPLKNALLTYALTIVCNDNQKGDTYDYDSYDGSKIPPLSGGDPVNTLMSYIVDSDNPHIHSKYNAIQRFLEDNLSNPYQQEDFIQQFLYILHDLDNSEQEEENYEESTDNKEKEE